MQIVFGEGAAPSPARPGGPARARAGPAARGRPGASRCPPPRPAPVMPCPCSPSRRAAPRAQALERRSGPATGGEEVHRATHQPRLQGRRPAGHLPPLRRHQRPQRGREPGGERQGHPEAQGGALGPGPRPHPEDQRPGLDPGRQRHPHRPPHRPPEGRAGPAQAAKENRPWPATSSSGASALSYAKAADLEATVKKVALSARGNITLDAAHQHHDHHRPPAEHRARRRTSSPTSTAPPRRWRSRRASWSRAATSPETSASSGASSTSRPRSSATRRTWPSRNSIVLNGQGVPGGGLPPTRAGLASGAGHRHTGRGYAVNLPGRRLQLRDRHLARQHPRQLQPRRRPDRPRAPGPRPPPLDAEGHDPEQPGSRDQAGRPDPASRPWPTTPSRCQFKDAVLTLKVTPQITEAGTVILNIDVQNNTRRLRATWCNGIPPINTQSAKTNVLVRDGATTVIGGIYQSNEQTSQQPTPFLSQDPAAGLPVPQPLRHAATNNGAALVHHAAHREGLGGVHELPIADDLPTRPRRKAMKVMQACSWSWRCALERVRMRPGLDPERGGRRPSSSNGINDGRRRAVGRAHRRRKHTVERTTSTVSFANRSKNPNVDHRAGAAGHRRRPVQVRYFRSDGRNSQGSTCPTASAATCASTLDFGDNTTISAQVVRPRPSSSRPSPTCAASSPVRGARPSS